MCTRACEHMHTRTCTHTREQSLPELSVDMNMYPQLLMLEEFPEHVLSLKNSFWIFGYEEAEVQL